MALSSVPTVDAQISKPQTMYIEISQDWRVPEDPSNPWNWKFGKKVFHTFCPAAMAFLAGFAGTIYVLGIEDVMENLGVSTTVAIMPYSLFLLGITFGPCIAAPCSENYGRKIVYATTVPCFALFILGSGFCHNVGALAVCQFFAGLFISPGLSVGSGMIADVWPVASRAAPMALYLAAPFTGPQIGAVIGGFATEKRNWRWTQWVILFLTILTFPPVLMMQETYKKIILKKRAGRTDLGRQDQQEDTNIGVVLVNFCKANFVRPLYMLFTELVVAAFGIYMAFILMLFFLTGPAIPFIYNVVYGFDLGSQGLVFFSFALGILAAAALVILLSKLMLAKIMKSGGTIKPAPEARLKLPKIMSIFLPVTLFWFGWSADQRVHWICPTIALFFITFSIFLLFMPCSLYVVDCYGPKYAASAVAATRIAGYLGGAAAPLFAIHMYSGLGIGWASSLLAFVALGLAPIPWIFARFGPRLRSTIKYGRPERSAPEGNGAPNRQSVDENLSKRRPVPVCKPLPTLKPVATSAYTSPHYEYTQQFRLNGSVRQILLHGV